MPNIKIDNLSHIYQKDTPFRSVALENINIEIPQGQFVGIIGHTGSGKSTFISHLNGLLSPTEGKVFHDDVDINSSKVLRHKARFKVGLVFQYPEYQLFEETVFRDIAFGPKNMGLSPEEVKERVEEAAKFTDISEELFEKSPLELSGGQKRRVAIAGVIAMKPEVLILDEPTAGLDPKACEMILSNIIEYKKATGATVILVSHSMDAISKIAERLMVFSHSHLVMDGTPEEIFKNSEELRQIGLDIPQTCEIALKLREFGFDIDSSSFTISSLKNAILALKGGNNNA